MRFCVSELLPGRLMFAFVVAIVDAVLVAWGVLHWYRRAVDRVMRSAQTSVALAPAMAVAVAAPSAIVSAGASGFSLVETRSEPPASSVLASSPRFLRVVLAYGCGAALHSAIVTAFKLAAEPIASPAGVLSMWWISTWPLVPTLFALGELRKRAMLTVAIAHVGLGALLVVAFTTVRQLLAGSLDLAPITNVYWMLVGLLITASVPFALVWVTGLRRVRAVTPLALSATLLFGFALILSYEVFILAFDREESRSLLLGLAGATSTEVARYAPFLIMSVPIGWGAWLILRGVAHQFTLKRFSDVQLVVDCWWVIVTAEQISVDLSSHYGASSLLIGAGAFAAYRSVVAGVLLGPQRPNGSAPRLLLLRVFGYQSRTESLFDGIAQRWRLRGPVQLIGGPDLASRTADPGDILAYLGGRLREQCVSKPADARRRIDALDVLPDPDGRYRINEVYCAADCWQVTLQALLGVSDVVLMDLRGFSRQNAGCRFELEQLLERYDTRKVVLVVDSTTDGEYLQSMLSDVWAASSDEGGEGGPSGEPRFTSVRIERQSSREIEGLFETLVAAADSRREGATSPAE